MRAHCSYNLLGLDVEDFNLHARPAGFEAVHFTNIFAEGFANDEEIGVPFPWDKYFQVVVRDFIAGGMENTSLTVLTDRTLFTRATEKTSRSTASASPIAGSSSVATVMKPIV